MTRNGRSLVTKGGFLTDTYRRGGAALVLRKLAAAVRMQLPILALGRRTNASVGAYFDLITDDGRLFYGDSFHFGYFKNDTRSFKEALDNHTDAVAEMAAIQPGARVLDVGCGICAPALRIASNHRCHITGINISAEQVRQGAQLIAKHGLSEKISVQVGNALVMNLIDNSFDSAICLEVAGDICVNHEQKDKLASEIFRVLKPGGRVGFSDLVFTGIPTKDEEQTMRTILYHTGDELITNWPDIFIKNGFNIVEQKNIMRETMKTWDHSLAVYEARADEVNQRYGKRLAKRTIHHLQRIPEILEKYGSFLLMSAEKPSVRSSLDSLRTDGF